MQDIRVGTGFDVHRLEENRPLVLGGVAIPFAKGLLGHSDADVIFHAVGDALLGALALGDLGKHFPDTDPAYKNADSAQLLAHIRTLVQKAGYGVGNVDVMLMAQAPKVAPYIPAMRDNMARILEIPIDRVSIKATTTEKLGFTGRGEGMAANAVVLLKSVPPACG